MRTYRPDIDGLRAVAVLSVVAFHASPNKVPGGFVGVDVFFVISGYLISSIVLAELEERKFSCVDFYARRIKRIFPALVLVLLACIAAGSVALVPGDYASLGQHTVAGGLFTSNLLSWSEVDYFNLTDNKPLLHLWSLGVEEQFYLLWPLCLFAFGRSRYRSIGIAAIAIASFALNVWSVASHPEAAFFSPVTRFWELMVGALLARHRCAWGSAASLSGALLIALSVVLSTNVNFPGWQALAPTVGAALIIAAGREAAANRALAHPALVFIGLISYPLYLWHWPVFCMMRNYDPDLFTGAMKIALIALSIALASATYLFIERPLKRVQLRRAAGRLAVAMAAVMGVGAVVWGGQGFEGRLAPEEAALLEDMRIVVSQRHADYRERACFLEHDQTFRDFLPECFGAESRALLWGDSHAAHLAYGLRDAAVGQLTASLCPPILGYEARSRAHCAETNRKIMEMLSRSNVPVILSAAWQDHEASFDLLEATLSRLSENGRKIVLLGPSPLFAAEPGKVLLRTGISDFVASAHIDKLRSVERRLAAIASKHGATFVSMLKYCERDRCKVRDHGRLMFLDGAHVTRTGAIVYGRYIKTALDLPGKVSPRVEIDLRIQ